MSRQEVFERWFLTLKLDATSKKILLRRDGDSYQDELVSGMYTGFCAGWELQKAMGL
jgi:hypothetical protein